MHTLQFKLLPSLRLWTCTIDIGSVMDEVKLIENCDIVDLRYKMELIYVSTKAIR